MKKKIKRVPLNIEVLTETRKRIDQLAEETGLKNNAIIDQSVALYFATYHKETIGQTNLAQVMTQAA